ncbi:hypothetical protein BP00DRAFT_446455 [Aspergillus indologenus CBS 114.80]|uniref:Uncharacterized protein n=1 Tax=Aspergillus indologenus CBS 114.80 TaxID=1450541 RepID=A0A2V5J9E0_9EURO|nr:hypothetical protein BP00DRAFT_446455 [Aspergillus indologenus CBS 114.80]
MDFPIPPPPPPSSRNASLADELPDYSTSPTAWLAAVARKAFPAFDFEGTWDIQITTDAAASSEDDDDHRIQCDVITVSHSVSGTVLILVTGPDDDNVSLEGPRSKEEEDKDAAAIVWQRRRACLQQQWEHHHPSDDDESSETKASSIHGAVVVRGQIIFDKFPPCFSNQSWVNSTTDNDAPSEPWRLSENGDRAWFADTLLEIRWLAGETRHAVAYWVWAKLGLSYADWLGLEKYDPEEELSGFRWGRTI